MEVTADEYAFSGQAIDALCNAMKIGRLLLFVAITRIEPLREMFS
jgi:hypothetical protein